MTQDEDRTVLLPREAARVVRPRPRSGMLAMLLAFTIAFVLVGVGARVRRAKSVGVRQPPSYVEAVPVSIPTAPLLPTSISTSPSAPATTSEQAETTPKAASPSSSKKKRSAREPRSSAALERLQRAQLERAGR